MRVLVALVAILAIAHATSATCADYCNLVSTKCAGRYTNPFWTNAWCMDECAQFPRNTSTSPVTSGNSLECRIWQLNQTSVSTNSQMCLWGAPAPRANRCGTACENYCWAINNVCTGANQMYESTTACVHACQNITAIPTTPTNYTLVTSGDSWACRKYHTIVASGSSTNAAQTHCPHAAFASGSNICGDKCSVLCSNINSICSSTPGFAPTNCTHQCASANADVSYNAARGSVGWNTKILVDMLWRGSNSIYTCSSYTFASAAASTWSVFAAFVAVIVSLLFI